MDPTTIVMIGVGAIIALLIRSNYTLRVEVHNLRQQVTALTNMLINNREGHTNEYDREALGRLGGAGRMDSAPGGIWHRGH